METVSRTFPQVSVDFGKFQKKNMTWPMSVTFRILMALLPLSLAFPPPLALTLVYHKLQNKLQMQLVPLRR